MRSRFWRGVGAAIAAFLVSTIALVFLVVVVDVNLSVPVAVSVYVGGMSYAIITEVFTKERT